jgi:hypothetical protein
MSKLLGRGVFAERDIESGSVIETCPVLVLDPVADINYIEKTSLYHYTYVWPSKDSSGRSIKTQAVIFGLGSMFNHSRDHQNVGWKRDLDRELIIYYALRHIRQGEELCISYGDRLTFEDVEKTAADNVVETAEEHLGNIQLT